MLRVTKLADYGIIMLTYFARRRESTCNARDLARAVNLPLPIVSKVLKLLSRHGLLMSERGAKGGYSLARPPEQISVASIICALEGPIAVTECTDAGGDCNLQAGCPVRTNWQLINVAIHSALERITLAQMTQPLHQSLINISISPGSTLQSAGGNEGNGL